MALPDPFQPLRAFWPRARKLACIDAAIGTNGAKAS
jgi:hypothetical protein